MFVFLLLLIITMDVEESVRARVIIYDMKKSSGEYSISVRFQPLIKMTSETSFQNDLRGTWVRYCLHELGGCLMVL